MNADKQYTMTHVQLAIILITIGSGIGIVRAPLTLTTVADQWGWIIAILAAGVFYLGAWLLIRLMEQFPGQSPVQFLPALIGKTGTIMFVWFFIFFIIFHFSVRIQSFSKEVAFFLFDRTPLEAVVLAFLLSSAYAGIQELGTLIRLAQLVFFTVLPLMIIFIAFGAINLELINFFPLLPEEPLQIMKSVSSAWQLYSGYELLLILLPFTARHAAGSAAKYVAGAFFIRLLLILLTFITVVGVLTAAGTKNTAYPTLLTVRSAELPGTFLERLDDFMLLSWIPIACLAVSIYMFCIAKLIAELHRFSDHRPFVLIMIPVLFFGIMSFHDIRLTKISTDINNWLGIFFSFVLVPAVLFIQWLKTRRTHESSSKPQ